ncbi:pimeloyl-ACP methyl ester esterase BioH [Thiolapillus sp.]
MTLWTDAAGKGDELLLIHGWGMNASVWMTLARELEKSHRVTLVELPGHGESPWTNTLQLEDWAEQVLAVAPPDAVWLGWSLGGQVMLQAASMQPHKLRGLVGIATSPCFVRREDWEYAIEPAVLESFAAELQADSRKTLRRFLSLQVQGATNAKSLLLQLRREFDSRPALRLSALQAGLAILLHTDLRPELSALDLPVNWLLGARDTLVPPGLAKALSRIQPRADLSVIEGAAHAPFLSHPGPCLELIDKFIRHV